MTSQRDESDISDYLRCVWKFGLLVERFQLVEMPQGFSVLRVGNQGAAPVLWAEVDPRRPRVGIGFWTYTTGPAEIPASQDWIGGPTNCRSAAASSSVTSIRTFYDAFGQKRHPDHAPAQTDRGGRA